MSDHNHQRFLESEAEANAELIEKLAAIEHERWSNWMKWLYENGEWLEDGSFAVNAQKANRWFTLTNVKYEDLDEPTKEYDRIEVRKTLEAIGLENYNKSDSAKGVYKHNTRKVLGDEH